MRNPLQRTRRVRARGHERGAPNVVIDEPHGFDPGAAGLLYDREAGVWHPTVERNCLYPTVEVENGHIGPLPGDWPAGTLIIGDKATGKCVAADELVLLEGTLIRAEEAGARYATTATYDGEGWWCSPLVQPLTCALDERTGRMLTAPVVRLYRQRVREMGRKIRLSDGSELTVTRRHRLRGADHWTRDLAVGDVVCVPRRIEYPGRKVDLELAELLAWQIAAGCESANSEQSRRGSSRLIISHADRAVLERLRELALNVAQCYSVEINTPCIEEHRTGVELMIDSAAWRDHLIRRGYEWGRVSAGKELPDFLMQGDLECARVVLRAFADAQGTVSLSRRTVELTTGSRALGEQLRHLLRRFGILASFPANRAAARNGANITRDCRRLAIGGDAARTFLAEIGFRDRRKDQRLQRMLTGMRSSSNPEGIYTQDIILEYKASGAPVAWLGNKAGWRQAPRLARRHAIALLDAMRAAADRLDCGRCAAPRAPGGAPRAGRVSTLTAIDTVGVRRLADRLERRL